MKGKIVKVIPPFLLAYKDMISNEQNMAVVGLIKLDDPTSYSGKHQKDGYLVVGIKACGQGIGNSWKRFFEFSLSNCGDEVEFECHDLSSGFARLNEHVLEISSFKNLTQTYLNDLI